MKLQFNNHPKQKQTLLDKLKNLGSGAFSLQQLLFDLDNAALQSVPTIEGIPPGSNAGIVLSKSFINIYFENVKTYGSPVLSVHAVATTPDDSSLRLTGMEREVGQFVDGNGVVIQNPTPAQKEVITLDYLCAANNNHLPGSASFDFNWVAPSDVDNVSGVISINRNTLANYYKDLLMPHVKQSCLRAWTKIQVWPFGTTQAWWNLTPGQTPQSAVVTPSGSEVLIISYSSKADAHDKSGATYGEMDIYPSFICTVSFNGNTITIVQHLVIWLKFQWDLSPISGNIIDKTITDTFTLSIGQNGKIQATAGTPVLEDDSKSIDFSFFLKIFIDMEDIIDGVKNYSDRLVSFSFSEIPASDIQNFVFPGAKAFAYKNVQFSKNQDLVSEITYVKPS